MKKIEILKKVNEAEKEGTTIFRIDYEGFAYGRTRCGDLFVGSLDDRTGRNTEFWKDNNFNREAAGAYWRAMSFSREVLL